MTDLQEQRADEREALASIYEGDTNFKQVDAKTFQYKYGEDDHYKSFLVEIQWTDNYPNELPKINLDTFYNRNLIPDVKAKIFEALTGEAQQWLGCGMTYTLFECLKDHQAKLTAEQPEHGVQVQSNEDSIVGGAGAIKISDSANDANKKKEPKREQLTKAQKRRQWERTDHKGDRPRGWDWVDIVKHLSQTGSKDSNETGSAISNGAANMNAAGALLQPLNI